MQAFESTVLNWPKAEQTRKISKNASFRSNEKLTQGNSKNSRLAKLKDFEALHRRYLEEAGLGYRHPEEEDMLNDLFAIARILRRWQIPTIIDPAALGMGSLWGAKGT